MPPARDTTDLLAEAIRLAEEDGVTALEHFLVGYPAQAAEIRHQLGILHRIGLMHHPPLPVRLGDFVLLECLGGGGMGTVYRAWQRGTERSVAVKVLRTDLQHDNGHRARFAREFASLARLEHPGILTAYEAGETDGLPWFAMPLVDGSSLADVLLRVAPHRAEPLTAQHLVPTPAPVGEVAVGASEAPDLGGNWEDAVVRLVHQVALALEHAHERGVLHRDIKPSNIMIDANGAARLIDFGLAALGGADRLTRTGAQFGSQPYIAPELLREPGLRADARTEVYALGVTLYEALTGKLPYEAETVAILQQRILAGNAPPPRSLNPAVSQDLETVCLAAIDPDPARRYATARAFANDLQRLLAGHKIEARRAGSLRRARLWLRNRPTLATATVLGALLLVSAVYYLWKQRDWTQRYRTIADTATVGRLLAEEAELWPALPDRIEGPRGMRGWLAEADALMARGADYAAALAEVRRIATAPPATGSTRALDRAQAAARQADLRAQLTATDQVRYGRTRIRALLEPALGEVTWECAERLAYDFADLQVLSRHDELAAFVRELDRLAVQHASVAERMQRALALRQRAQEVSRDAWLRCVAEIAASPRYGGLRLVPQPELLPIGWNRRTGLYEFVHLLSGSGDVERDADGGVRPGIGTGIALVLLPGGAVLLGAEPPSVERAAAGPNVDARAEGLEGPVHEEVLAPYFIAKYELTQDQWMRIMLVNYADFAPPYRIPDEELSAEMPDRHGHTMTLLHPVEQVTWHDCAEYCRRVGLQLPTEAQWEYAARAGNGSRFWTGDDPTSLSGRENLFDRYAYAHNQHELYIQVKRDTPIAITSAGLAVAKRESPAPGSGGQLSNVLYDGHLVHAPVGSFSPNPFGLFDTIGNVREWCSDGTASHAVPSTPSNGGHSAMGDAPRSVRGGCFASRWPYARVTYRTPRPPDQRDSSLGLRPARAVVR